MGTRATKSCTSSGWASRSLEVVGELGDGDLAAPGADALEQVVDRLRLGDADGDAGVAAPEGTDQPGGRLRRQGGEADDVEGAGLEAEHGVDRAAPGLEVAQRRLGRRQQGPPRGGEGGAPGEPLDQGRPPARSPGRAGPGRPTAARHRGRRRRR